MKNHIRAKLAHRAHHSIAVAYVAAQVGLKVRTQIHCGIVRRFGGYIVGKTAHHSTELA